MSSYILNCTFPKADEELIESYAENGHVWYLYDAYASGDRYIGWWTGPKHINDGDVCFLACAKSSVKDAKKLTESVDRFRGTLGDSFDEFRKDAADTFRFCEEHAGCIVGKAVATGYSAYAETPAGHWQNRSYVELDGFSTVPYGVSVDALPVKLNTFGGITLLDDEQANILSQAIL